MATHDYIVDNQNGANFRSDLNNALAAIVSNNSSATAPTTTYAFMLWADTASDLLKQRNAADSAWVDILTLSTGAVSNAEVADNAITLAKMAHGTDGEIITYDASGAPATVGVGTSGQVLTSNGAGSAPSMQGLPSSGADTSLSNFFLGLPDSFFKKVINKLFFGQKWLRVFPNSKMKDWQRIYESAKKNNLPVMEFMIHSSELMPGGSPYAKDHQSVEFVYQQIEDLFKFLKKQGLQGRTLSEFYYDFK